MNETQKKVAAGTTIGAGVGFVAGLLLHRPKAKGQLVLSDLVVAPVTPGAALINGTDITITCNVTNNGPTPVTAVIAAQIGNDVLMQNLTIRGVVPVTFYYTLGARLSPYFAITVSIDPLTVNVGDVVG